MQRLCAAVALINLLAMVAFAAEAFIVPLRSELSARMAFTELDRAGAINATALDPNGPNYGFNSVSNLDYRRTVPIFIAQDALAAERDNAWLGLLVTSLTFVASSAAWLSGRERQRKVTAKSDI
jgi:hypothetical protein